MAQLSPSLSQLFLLPTFNFFALEKPLRKIIAKNFAWNPLDSLWWLMVKSYFNVKPGTQARQYLCEFFSLFSCPTPLNSTFWNCIFQEFLTGFLVLHNYREDENTEDKLGWVVGGKWRRPVKYTPELWQVSKFKIFL